MSSKNGMAHVSEEDIVRIVGSKEVLNNLINERTVGDSSLIHLGSVKLSLRTFSEVRVLLYAVRLTEGKFVYGVSADLEVLIQFLESIHHTRGVMNFDPSPQVEE